MSFLAALRVAFCGRLDAQAPTETPTVDELRARAAESRDDHVIKLTEAALRSYAVDADPIYLQAAARA